MKTKTDYKILGIMSGTSLDGVDLALCSFSKDKKWKYEIQKTKTILYSKDWKEKLNYLYQKSNKEIAEANSEYGKYLAILILKFKQEHQLSFDYIASHGHTIFHQPENNFTLQIGCGKTISETTKITTINDFRSLDISLGGQGAPLVPVGDLHLFTEYKYCLNLGGFSNISIKEKEKIIAFDICPVNIVLNQLSQNLGLEFDKNGDFAKSGNLIPELLNKLNELDYYKQKPPKSLSREWVKKNINPLLTPKQKTEDLLHTLCEHIAIQISKYLIDEKALFAGGGVFNSYLMERIKHFSKSEIIMPSKEIIEFKESLIFAFLGILKLRNEVNCLKSVTGARRDNCGGIIHAYS